jgi:hypothetical protein
VVFEREIFPRPHVGESLVPSSTRVFKELGILSTMEDANFPRKYGVVWTASADSPVHEHDWDGLQADSRADIDFAERAPRGCRPELRPPRPPGPVRQPATAPRAPRRRQSVRGRGRQGPRLLRAELRHDPLWRGGVATPPPRYG